MPLYGTLDIAQSPARLPTLAQPRSPEAWALPEAEMMQLLIEVPRASTSEGLLPKAMHPRPCRPT